MLQQIIRGTVEIFEDVRSREFIEREMKKLLSQILSTNSNNSSSNAVPREMPNGLGSEASHSPVADLIEKVCAMTPEERRAFQEAFEYQWFDATKKHYSTNPEETPTRQGMDDDMEMPQPPEERSATPFIPSLIYPEFEYATKEVNANARGQELRGNESRKFDPAAGVSPEIAFEADGLFCEIMQLLYTLKNEWEAEKTWSEWDEGVMERARVFHKKMYEAHKEHGQSLKDKNTRTMLSALNKETRVVASVCPTREGDGADPERPQTYCPTCHGTGKAKDEA